MNARTHVGLRIAAACIFFGALADAWLLWRQIAQVQIQLAAATSQQVAIDASVTEARTRIATQKRSLATAQKVARAAESRTAAAANPGERPGRVNVNALLESDPKLLAIYLKSFRANLSDRFGPLFQRLGLTPYQIGKWEDLATAQEQSNVDLRMAAAAQGLNYAQDPGIIAMKKQTGAQLYQAFVAAVGADVAQQIDAGLSGYTAVPNGMVPMVTNIATLAAQNGTPMNYQQMGEVGTLLASNFTPNPAVGGSMDWDKIASQATTSLSGPQLEAVQTMASLYQLSARVKQFYSAQGGSP
jgi:hypothetical protein